MVVVKRSSIALITDSGVIEDGENLVLPVLNKPFIFAQSHPV